MNWNPRHGGNLPLKSAFTAPATDRDPGNGLRQAPVYDMNPAAVHFNRGRTRRRPRRLRRRHDRPDRHRHGSRDLVARDYYEQEIQYQARVNCAA
jgi:hypothetical protein